MIRVLIFILSVIFVAGTVTYFASMSDRIEAEAFGLKYDIHAGAAMVAIVIAAGALILFTSWFKDITALPGKLRSREKEARRTRGVAALTRGLEAVAVGDASDAQHHARVAQRNLDNNALTRLLTAQAAEIAGDEKTAGENFTAMLEAPETEFLGLRGLYLKAIREGDKKAAQAHAERAFRLRPNAKWAFQSVFDLGLDRGAWGETRNALTIALKNKIIDSAEARRGEVALLTADAYAAALSGDNALALQEAEAALKLAPGFAPAATVAAEQHNNAGKRGRAAKILEQAFAEAPHPALIKAHGALFADEETSKRAEQMKKIADRKPTAREAKLNMARRATLLGDHEEAISILEPLLMEKATARETAAMAEAVAGAHGPETATIWLEQAAAAPRDPSPGADGAFHFTRDGWARLVREYMNHNRLAPPPLENAPRGLSLDELKLLAPPAAAAAAEIADEAIDTPVEEETSSVLDKIAQSPDAEKETTQETDAEAIVPDNTDNQEADETPEPGAAKSDEEDEESLLEKAERAAQAAREVS